MFYQFFAKILFHGSFLYEVNFSHFELIQKEWLLSVIYPPSDACKNQKSLVYDALVDCEQQAAFLLVMQGNNSCVSVLTGLLVNTYPRFQLMCVGMVYKLSATLLHSFPSYVLVIDPHIIINYLSNKSVYVSLSLSIQFPWDSLKYNLIWQWLPIHHPYSQLHTRIVLFNHLSDSSHVL